jgi:putative aldouronate transport system permease protein
MAAIKERGGDRVFDATCHIIVTLLLLIVLYPLIYIISCSISDPNYVAKGEVWLLPKGINFKGYERVFKDPNIMKS